MAHGPTYRRIVALDVERFTRAAWGDPVRVRVRERLHRLLDSALSLAGIDQAATGRHDTGDGMLLLVDASVPMVQVLGPLLTLLAAGLAADNRQAPAGERVRVRMVVHAGEVLTDRIGMAGDSVNVAARLLDADVGRAALANVPEAEIVVLASARVHADVIRHGYAGVDPAGWQPVLATGKGGQLRAWLHLPGCSPRPPVRSVAGAVNPAARAAAARPERAGFEPDGHEDGSRWAARQTGEAGDEVRRRELLTYVGAVAGGLGMDVFVGDRAVGAMDVTVAERVTRRLGTLKESMSAQRFYRILSRHVGAVHRLARQADGSRVRQGLLGVLAQTQADAGWVAAFDLQDRRRAARRFHGALRAAHDAADPIAGGAVCLRLADSALYTGELRDALELAVAGRNLVGRDDPPLEVALATTIAQAQAGLGRDAAARTTMDGAEQVAGVAGFGPSRWAKMDRQRLAGDRGLVALALGRFTDADGDLRVAIAAQPPGNGHRAMLSVGLARALFAQGDPDGAAAVALPSIEVLARLGSKGRVANLACLNPYLRRHSDRPVVRELGERLRLLDRGLSAGQG